MSTTPIRNRDSNSDALLRAWCRLRCAAFASHAAFVPETGRAGVTRFLSKGLAFVTAGRGDLATWVVDGELRAVAAFWREDDSWYGTPCQVGAVDAALDDPDAIAWLGATMASWSTRLVDDFDLLLDSAYTPLLAHLEPLGLGVDSAQIVGEPARALARLGPTAETVWRRDGLRVHVLDAERVDDVVALKREVFARHPEYCWFYPNDGFADRDAQSIRASLATGIHRVLVDRDDAVVGYVAAGIDLENPFWGSVAGMDLVLAESLRGRGLLRPLYHLLLRELTARRVAAFKGGTSQPPVMHLARELDREVIGWIVRRNPPFPPSHWRPLDAGWPLT